MGRDLAIPRESALLFRGAGLKRYSSFVLCDGCVVQFKFVWNSQHGNMGLKSQIKRRPNVLSHQTVRNVFRQNAFWRFGLM